jgi:hypothetical protein
MGVFQPWVEVEPMADNTHGFYYKNKKLQSSGFTKKKGGE